jgi:hemerythrin-like metal-binding protein
MSFMVETIKSGLAPKAVTWSAQYSVGIASIDSEHQKLIGMLNDLHAAMTQGQGRAVMGKVLDGLSAYTVSHFANEENLMRLHSYSEYSVHRAEHDKLTKQVRNLQEDFRAGNATISLDVLAFLKNWLINHIVGVDKKYSALLKAGGVK